MDGIHESVARRYSPAQLAKLFGPGGEHIRVIYERPNGDRTSPISSSLHSTYAGKGWKAVEVYSDPEVERAAPIEVPATIAEHARHDRVAIWKRGDDVLEVSCRQALSMLTKGYVFSGLAGEARRSALSRARPWPPAAPGAVEPATEEPAAAQESKRR